MVVAVLELLRDLPVAGAVVVPAAHQQTGLVVSAVGAFRFHGVHVHVLLPLIHFLLVVVGRWAHLDRAVQC